MKEVLFVVSAADHWTLNDGTEHPTGYWGEELAVPHRRFSEAGWRITIATPNGVAPTLDKLSMGVFAGIPSKRKQIRTYLDSIQDDLNHPMSLDQVSGDEYDLIFYPGGHGPMEDLAVDPISGGLLTERLHSGRPLALLCHAPAALLAAQNADGSWPFTGYRLTALSNFEERLNTFARKAKWLLEDALKQRGALYEKGPIPLRPFAVVDRNLYTGQNPQSADLLASRIIDEIGA